MYIRELGLGLGSLTPTQIYQYALQAGFPTNVATQMTAIALRESSGNPSATNLSNKEQSYGLWQINVQGNPGLLQALGLTDPSQLLDPATNARAANYLYGGNPNNLNVAWYINQPGYAEAYQQYLPVAQQAALDVTGGSGIDISSTVANLLEGNTSGTEIDWIMIGIGAIALYVVAKAIL